MTLEFPKSAHSSQLTFVVALKRKWLTTMLGTTCRYKLKHSLRALHNWLTTIWYHFKAALKLSHSNACLPRRSPLNCKRLERQVTSSSVEGSYFKASCTIDDPMNFLLPSTQLKFLEASRWENFNTGVFELSLLPLESLFSGDVIFRQWKWWSIFQ